MSIVLLIVQLLVQLVLLAVILTVTAFAVWVWWDCTAGLSAQLRRDLDRRGGGRGA